MYLLHAQLLTPLPLIVKGLGSKEGRWLCFSEERDARIAVKVKA